MMNTHTPEQPADQPVTYEIRIKGYLGRHRADWFEGLTITRQEDGSTVLTGSMIDQAALHGLLRKVRDLGMLLLSVNRVDPQKGDSPDAE